MRIIIQALPCKNKNNKSRICHVTIITLKLKCKLKIKTRKIWNFELYCSWINVGTRKYFMLWVDIHSTRLLYSVSMLRRIRNISLNVMPDINIAITDVSGYQAFKVYQAWQVKLHNNIKIKPNHVITSFFTCNLCKKLQN